MREGIDSRSRRMFLAGGAVALGSDELELDPVLLAATDIVEKRWGLVHVEDQDVHCAIVVIVPECGAATGVPCGNSLAHLG